MEHYIKKVIDESKFPYYKTPIDLIIKVYNLFAENIIKEILDPDIYYYYGIYWNIKNNYEKSIEYFNKGCEQNDPYCYNAMAICNFNEDGLKFNKKEVVKYFAKAAEMDNDEGLKNLAVCYFDGLGIEKNDDIAYDLIKKAVDLNNIDAMVIYGCKCIGLNNYEEGKKLLLTAADRGSVEAMNNLVKYYYTKEKSLLDAIKWMAKLKRIKCMDNEIVKIIDEMNKYDLIDIIDSFIK